MEIKLNQTASMALENILYLAATGLVVSTGLAALLGMLNSCASNVTVVNIDNGFGAGYVASLINRV